MTRALLLLLMMGGPALAANEITVGVFLPTTVGDGQQRFDFGEKLAASLSAALKIKASARNFAKYGDFMDALSHGKLDVAVVDAWIAAESADAQPLVAFASLNGSTKRRWAVVGKQKSIAGVLGKPLALTRGAGNADGNFVTNAVFEGALQADKAMKPTYAPSVESALRMLSLGNADAALVPASMVPADAKILYQSAPLPIAAVLVVRSRAEAVKQALPKLGAVAPFDGFSAVPSDELGGLRRLIASGPPARPPVWVEPPLLPLDAHSLVTFEGLAPQLPSFLDLVTPSKEQPDD